MPMNMAQQPGQISVTKLMGVLSDILSEKYGCKITLTARPKQLGDGDPRCREE